jgi:hypothetical protein
MTQRRRFPFVTALLVTMVTAGLVAAAGGTAVAVYANSPANRTGNPYWGIGVAVGVAIAMLGGLVVLIFATALARSRNR